MKVSKEAKIKTQIQKLPHSAGVYFFLNKDKKILYIGKATSLKTRVKSYFAKDIREKRSPLIEKMVLDSHSIDFKKTDSVLEALILEAALIQKHLPPYNTDGKDQKSWNYVVVTGEDFPRVLLMRQRELEFSDIRIKYKFGPFTHGAELQAALKIVRKIFPYRDKKCAAISGKPCFNYQIGLCPGVCIGKVSKAEYAKTIRNISLFFQGKKGSLIKTLARDMKMFAKQKQFEKAAELKYKIHALEHIRDIALIKDNYGVGEIGAPGNFRIESYDISHISGTNMVGVMTVMEYGSPKKQDYRKFNIRGQQGSDDVKALREVVRRRFNHSEWPQPNLIVVDGGTAQVNGVKAELESLGTNIPMVGVVKDERHKPKDILLGSSTPKLEILVNKYRKEILITNNEAHRFALAFHRKKRRI